MNFPNFPDELSKFHSTFLIFPNFPDELSEFSGWTFRILLNFPNFSSQNRWGLFFFLFFFWSHPLKLSEFCSTFRIFRTNFPNFVQLSEFFPNFPDELSEFFDYWPLSALCWGVCWVSVKCQGGVVGCLSDSGYCLAGVVWWGYDVKLIDNKNLIRVILISWFLLSQVPRYVWRLSGKCLSGAWWLSEWIWILSGGYGVQAIDKHPIRHFLLVCSFFPLVALDWSKCAIFWGVWRVSGRCLGGVWGMSEWLWIMPGGIWVECN